MLELAQQHIVFDLASCNIDNCFMETILNSNEKYTKKSTSTITYRVLNVVANKSLSVLSQSTFLEIIGRQIS